MVTQVIGRVNGKGLTSIWKSDSLKQNILQQNKFYAEMKPFIKEETAFLYSSKYCFIAAGNHFSQTATESRSHAVNYFTYMDKDEMKQFQKNVSIDFEKARQLGDESEAETDGTESFIRKIAEREEKINTFSKGEQKLLMEVMCHVKNGIPVNIICDKKREFRLFTNMIRLFPKAEIGLNVNLGTNISIAINSKISDAMELTMKSGKVDMPEEISKILENMEEAIAFWNKIDILVDEVEITDTDLVNYAKERLEEKKWESLGVQKMIWPTGKPTEYEAFSMQQTLMNLYFTCEGLKEKEDKFCLLQELYKKELSKMIDAQVVKPIRDKRYVALALMVCFKSSPYQQYAQQKNVEKYAPICIYKNEVEEFLLENNVNKLGIMLVWKEMKKLVITSVVGE